jgi:hypothetical protein
VDRLLSNPMINVDDILMRWVPYVVGARNAIVVALDWTDFDADKQATIMVPLITDHCLPRRKPAPGLRSGQAPGQAFAVVLLTLLGAAGEALGYDRMLKTNTVKRRVHSLFRQGCMLYDLIPTMPETRLRPLMQRFSRMLNDQPLFADVFGPV